MLIIMCGVEEQLQIGFDGTLFVHFPKIWSINVHAVIFTYNNNKLFKALLIVDLKMYIA